MIKIDRSRIEIKELISIFEDLLNFGETNVDLIFQEAFPIEIENNDVFYHGTSKFLGDIIEEVGNICVKKVTKMRSIYYEKIPDFIYLSKDKDDAYEWAKRRAEVDKAAPVVFKVLGKDINDAKCKAYIDFELPLEAPSWNVVLKYCDCVKAVRIS